MLNSTFQLENTHWVYNGHKDSSGIWFTKFELLHILSDLRAKITDDGDVIAVEAPDGSLEVFIPSVFFGKLIYNMSGYPLKEIGS